jgi:hypothetical protein
VDISLAKLRVQFDDRSVSLCDRFRFQEKSGVAHTVTTVQAFKLLRNEKPNEVDDRGVKVSIIGIPLTNAAR